MLTLIKRKGQGAYLSGMGDDSHPKTRVLRHFLLEWGLTHIQKKGSLYIPWCSLWWNGEFFSSHRKGKDVIFSWIGSFFPPIEKGQDVVFWGGMESFFPPKERAMLHSLITLPYRKGRPSFIGGIQAWAHPHVGIWLTAIVPSGKSVIGLPLPPIRCSSRTPLYVGPFWTPPPCQQKSVIEPPPL